MASYHIKHHNAAMRIYHTVGPWSGNFGLLRTGYCFQFLLAMGVEAHSQNDANGPHEKIQCNRLKPVRNKKKGKHEIGIPNSPRLAAYTASAGG